MRSRRKLAVVGIGALIGLLFLVAGYLLIRGGYLFRHSFEKLMANKQQLESLYKHDPFPSEQNLAQERQNLADLNGELTRLLASLSAGQVEPVSQGPEKFSAQFWETRDALLKRAQEVGVAVPADFAFGFSRHLSGVLPVPHDVPRLTQQLQIVQRLCGLLLDARVTELRGIGREEFESGVGAGEEPAAGGAGRSRDRKRPAAVALSLNVVQPNAGLVPAEAQYGKWHFVLDFSAKESAVLDVLNRFAKDQLFIVVTHVELTGDDKSILQVQDKAKAVRARGQADPAADTNTAEVATRDSRIVCGQDIAVGVKMELDVYQFRRLPSEGAGAKPAQEG